MRLLIKRIALITILLASIGFLTVYAYQNQDDNDVLKYMNLRDQSDDYDHLFDQSLFKSFTIHFDEAVFDEMLSNMEEHFNVYGNYIDNTMYPVDITYSDGTDSFTVYEVGFRTKSSTSRNLPRTEDWRGRYVYHQTSFQLQFNETFSYDDRSNMYEILKTREVFNLEQLNFEYSQVHDSDYDTAMISEAYVHHLYQEAGLVVANASYGLVYLEIGDTLIPYGFFTFIESIDSEFLKANFKSNLALEYGDLFKVTDVLAEGTLKSDYQSLIGIDTDDYRFTYSLRNNSLDGTRRTFDSFDHFITAINNTEYMDDHMDEIIDMDLFIRYLAIAFLVGSTDDIRYNFNNYYLYFDVYTNKVTFIPFDLDSSLGFGKSLDLSGEYTTGFDIDYNLVNPSPLVDYVFNDETLTLQYESYLRDFIENIFLYQDFHTMYLSAKDLYEGILQSEMHLGNKVFDERNLEWYFTTKSVNVMTQLA